MASAGALAAAATVASLHAAFAFGVSLALAQRPLVAVGGAEGPPGPMVNPVQQEPRPLSKGKEGVTIM